MIDCAKAGALIEQGEFEKLNFFQKRKLRFHIKMCGLCAKYEQDNRVMAKIFKMLASKNSAKCLSEVEKNKLKQKLASEQT